MALASSEELILIEQNFSNICHIPLVYLVIHWISLSPTDLICVSDMEFGLIDPCTSDHIILTKNQKPISYRILINY